MHQSIITLSVLFSLVSTSVQANPTYEICAQTTLRDAYKIFLMKQQGYNLQQMVDNMTEFYGGTTDDRYIRAMADAGRVTAMAMVKKAAFSPVFNPDRVGQAFALRCLNEATPRIERLPVEERMPKSARGK